MGARKRFKQNQPRWWGAVKLIYALTAAIFLVLWFSWTAGLWIIAGVSFLVFLADIPICRKWKRDHPQQ